VVGYEYFGSVSFDRDDDGVSGDDGGVSGDGAPHNIFSSPLTAVYELVILTLTGDNFGDLMPIASLKHPSCKCVCVCV
jgi:hypothetical protein